MYFLSNPPVYFLPGTWETVHTSIYEPIFGLVSFSIVIVSATLISSLALKRTRKRV